MQTSRITGEGILTSFGKMIPGILNKSKKIDSPSYCSCQNQIAPYVGKSSLPIVGPYMIVLNVKTKLTTEFSIY